MDNIAENHDQQDINDLLLKCNLQLFEKKEHIHLYLKANFVQIARKEVSRINKENPIEKLDYQDMLVQT